LEDWTGRRILEIEGPKRYSPNEAASLLRAAIGRPVSAYAVPRDQWEALFRAQGTAWPPPRIAMLDGFNSGWIDFEGEAEV
jgi:NAD(P)H dehydrogenase (quinone)